MILLTKIMLKTVLNPTLTISSFIVNIFVMVWLRGAAFSLVIDVYEQQH